MSAELKPGMRVSLFVPQTKLDEVAGTLMLNTTLEAVRGDLILIQMPMYHGHYYMLPEEPVPMRFFSDSKPYSYFVQFEERIEREGFVMAKLRLQGECMRHQMRDYFRIECFLSASITHRDTEASAAKDAKKTGPARILDLSEGGALLASSEKVEREEEIEVSFETEGTETIDALVKRVSETEHGKYSFHIGVKFLYRDKNQSDRIYKLVMQLQRTQMKRTMPQTGRG